MRFCCARLLPLLFAFALLPAGSLAQGASSSSNSGKHVKKPAVGEVLLEPGAVLNGVYRNKSLGLACKIPDGWVLRTEEMSAREEDDRTDAKTSPQGAQGNTEDGRAGRVLLAAFSRPPEVRGEDINSSILIAAESVLAYPGMTDAAQYFGPLAEVAKAQWLEVDEEPYEFALGTKKVVRGDFHKDVGSRVMRQSILSFLSHAYAVSISMIGATYESVEGFVGG